MWVFGATMMEGCVWELEIRVSDTTTSIAFEMLQTGGLKSISDDLRKSTSF